jgi:hypothetical protein
VSERFIGSPERVPKFGKRFFEPDQVVSWAIQTVHLSGNPTYQNLTTLSTDRPTGTFDNSPQKIPPLSFGSKAVAFIAQARLA